MFEFAGQGLTKLIVTFSMILFGGYVRRLRQHWSWGWRFMNLVVGALMVLVLYC